MRDKKQEHSVNNQIRINNIKTPLDLLFQILFQRWPQRFFILLISFASAFFGILGPFFQKEFVDVMIGSAEMFSWSLRPLHYLVLSFFSLLGTLSFNQWVNYLGTKESLLMQKELARKLYDKTLELKSENLEGRTVGEIVAIYASDVPSANILLDQSLPQFLGIIFPIILFPFALKFLVDMSVTWILLTMLAVGLLNFSLAFRQSIFFFQFKKLAADRIALVNEWIQNIRTLRILNWTGQFEKKIFIARKMETKNRIAMLTNGQSMNSIGSCITFVFNLVAIYSLVYSSNTKVSSGTLLALLWLVAIFLTRPFRQMPWLFTFIFDGWTSIKRLHEILILKNDEKIKTFQVGFEEIKSPKIESSPAISSAVEEAKQQEVPALLVQNLNFSIGEETILKNISFEVRQKEFIAIVGKVASGKSALLLSLLRENSSKMNEYHLFGENVLDLPLEQIMKFYSYVPQEGFIMSASLRENVLFQYDGSKAEDELILRSLENAQFNLQKERINEGLDTEIGERGVNLSGGQRQRVSLARIDFYKAPILLLDDCLSALDVETEVDLISHLFKGEWKDSTRILVTHRLTVLKEVDRVLYLENGELKAYGKFEELMEKSPEFREYTSSLRSLDSQHPISDIQLPIVQSHPIVQSPIDKRKKNELI